MGAHAPATVDRVGAPELSRPALPAGRGRFPHPGASHADVPIRPVRVAPPFLVLSTTSAIFSADRNFDTGTLPMNAWETIGTMSLSVCAPSTMPCTSSTLTPAASARYVRKRALSSTPAEPITRSRGKPVTCLATNTIASSGFDTTTSTALGACFFTSWQMPLTMPALMLISSSRD